MRTIQKLLVLVTVLSFSTVMAQGRGGQRAQQDPEEAANERVEKYAEPLQLDELQKALLKANFIEYGKKQRSLFTSEMTREEKRDSMQGLRKEQLDKLAEFLTEEQLTTLKELQQKERKKRRGSRRGGRDRG